MMVNGNSTDKPPLCLRVSSLQSVFPLLAVAAQNHPKVGKVGTEKD